MMVAWLVSIAVGLGALSAAGFDPPCHSEVAEWSSLARTGHVTAFPIRLVEPNLVVSGPVRVRAAPLEEMDLPAAVTWIRRQQSGRQRLVPGLDWKLDRATKSAGQTRFDLSAVFRGRTVWALVLVSRPSIEGDGRIVDAALVEYTQARVASWRGREIVTLAYRRMSARGFERGSGVAIRLLDPGGVVVARSRTDSLGMATVRWSEPGFRLLVVGRGRHRCLVLLNDQSKNPGTLVGHLALSRTKVEPGNSIAIGGVASAVTSSNGSQGAKRRSMGGRGPRRDGLMRQSGHLVVRLVAPGRGDVVLGPVKWGKRGLFAGRVQVPGWISAGPWVVTAQDPVTGWALRASLLVQGPREHLELQVVATPTNVRAEVRLRSPWRGPVGGAKVEYRWGWRTSCAATSDVQGGAGSTCLDARGRASIMVTWPMQDVGCLWVDASMVRGGALLSAHGWWPSRRMQELHVGSKDASWRIVAARLGWSWVHVQDRGTWSVVTHHGATTETWPCWSASPWSMHASCLFRTVASGDVSLMRSRSSGGWELVGRRVFVGSDQQDLYWPRILQNPAMVDAVLHGDMLVVWPDAVPATTPDADGVGLVCVVCGGRRYRRFITDPSHPVRVRVTRCPRAQVFVDWVSRVAQRRAWASVDGHAAEIGLDRVARTVAAGRPFCLSATMHDRFGRAMASDMAVLMTGGGDVGSALWLVSGTPQAGQCLVAPRRAGVASMVVMAGAGGGQMAVLPQSLLVTALPRMVITGPDLVRVGDQVCLDVDWTGDSSVDVTILGRGVTLHPSGHDRMKPGHQSICGAVGHTKSMVSVEVDGGRSAGSEAWRSRVEVPGAVGLWGADAASLSGRRMGRTLPGSARVGSKGLRLVPRGKVAALACSGRSWVRLVEPALRIVDWDGGLDGVVARAVLSGLSWWNRLGEVARLIHPGLAPFESRRSLLARLHTLQRPDGWFERVSGGMVAPFRRQVQVATTLIGLHVTWVGRRRLLAALAGRRPATVSQAAVILWAQAQLGLWDWPAARRVMRRLGELQMGEVALFLAALASRDGNASALDRVLIRLRSLVAAITSCKNVGTKGSWRRCHPLPLLWSLSVALHVIDHLLPGHVLAQRLSRVLFNFVAHGGGDATDRALAIQALWAHWRRRASLGRQDVIEVHSNAVVHHRVVGCRDDAMILTGSDLSKGPVLVQHRGDCALHCALFWNLTSAAVGGVRPGGRLVWRAVAVSGDLHRMASANSGPAMLLRTGQTVAIRLDVDLSDSIEAGTRTCLREILPGGLILVGLLTKEGHLTRVHHGFDLCSNKVRYSVTYEAVARFSGRYRGGSACVRTLDGPVACSSDWSVRVTP